MTEDGIRNFVDRPRAVRRGVHIAASLVILLLAGSSFAATPTTGPANRSFRFTYAATITGLTAQQHARVWLPMPPSNAQQQVDVISQQLPVTPKVGQEQKYGNRVLYFEANADDHGEIPLRITYRVTRHECGESDLPDAAGLIDELWLQPDALVPVGGRSLTLLEGKTLPTDSLQLARVLYDVVDDHMEYRKDKPGFGRGDADWACDSGFGNCTDFHSLFISLARANHIPARFEMGFPIAPAGTKGPSPIAGYHCWAWCKPAAHAWVPVDISEANKHPDRRNYFFGHLDADRVAFSIGRDLTLVPPQDGPPLNYFAYPYVEVDRKPHPLEKIMRHFESEEITPVATIPENKNG
ncbi:MAG TPA: transglutaminase domain-containing protein [Tepidisphaeraceae bacterium]|nr:transglutaminase domain-containing protein [Tepidisphaeraceae bacterium]